MWHILATLELVVTFVLCGFAIVFGRAPDRIGSILIVASYIFDSAGFLVTGPHFPTAYALLGDFILAVCLLYIAVRYGSLWVGCAMLLQSVNLCSQALSIAGLGLHDFSQMTLNNVVSVAMCTCVAAGAAGSLRTRLKAKTPWPAPRAGLAGHV